MAYIQLPDELIQLHAVFGRKKLRGEIGEIAQAFREHSSFRYYANKARMWYGLTPRQLSIHFALACILTPKFLRWNHCSVYLDTRFPLHRVDRMAAIQMEYLSGFWSRLS